MVSLGFEPGPQDGRRRRNHGAMAAPLPVIDVIKLFWRKSRFPQKLRNWITFVLMIEPWTKTFKHCYSQLNYIQTLFFCSEMVYSCCFSLGGNLDFLDFLQKKFLNINYRKSMPDSIFAPLIIVVRSRLARLQQIFKLSLAVKRNSLTCLWLKLRYFTERWT